MKHAITVLRILSAVSVGLCFAHPVHAGETQAWPSTLYRNGGYYGPANSDQGIENKAGPDEERASQPNKEVQAELPQPSSKADTAVIHYDGTRYRNGGHWGDKKSDVALEN